MHVRGMLGYPTPFIKYNRYCLYLKLKDFVRSYHQMLFHKIFFEFRVSISIAKYQTLEGTNDHGNLLGYFVEIVK